jgi:uncharacterized protein DUF3768
LHFGTHSSLACARDAGAIDLHCQKWFWKIDYYATDMRMGSDDPADIDKTHRVLTIMHASEY